MIITLEKFIKQHDSGLFLLDSPTGFGKTTAVLKIIKEFLNCKNFTEIDKMFFVTNLKTNLPIDSLIEQLTEDEKKECVRIKAYDETVVENWESAIIPNDLIRNSKEYKALNSDIEILQELKKEKNYLIQQGELYYKKQKSINSFENKIATITEPAFRKLIQTTFFYGQSLIDKKKFIKDNEWFRKLYPICDMEKKKVILMTTAKFFSPINLFYRMPFFMYDDAIIKNSVVFIDEFDASKKVVLDQLIENSLKMKIDVINLFLNIYYTLKWQTFPANLLRMAEVSEDTTIEEEPENDYYTSDEILTLNKEKFEKCYKDHNLNLLLKSVGFNQNQSFLFDDGNYITVYSNNQNKHLKVKADSDSSLTNVLTAEKRKPADENLLRVMLNDIYSCITYFAHGVKFLANNYYRYINTTRIGFEHKYTLDEALITILNAFNLNGGNREYMQRILTDGRLNISFDERFTRKGFKFIEIEDSEYHSLQTIAHQFNFETTPENLIMLIAQSARLIGISATASLDTVIGNYDLNYIKQSLGNRYVEIDEEDKTRIKKNFDATQKIYEKINCHIDIVDDLNCFLDKDKIIELLKKIFKDENFLICKEKLNQICPDDYYRLIIVKLLYLYKEVGKGKIKSFICFLNKLPKTDDKKLNLVAIRELFDLVAKEAEFERYRDFVISSDNYDDEMDEVYKELKCGKKCFVISTYQTVGSGKNIQYDIPPTEIDNVIIQDRERFQKDFDGIYLQKPTNLIQQFRADSEDKYEDLMRYLYQQQILYLNKKMISGRYRQNVINGFRRCFFNSKNYLYSQNLDVSYHTAQLIIQAVGRICRCRNKNKDIYIFTDTEVVEKLQRIKSYLSKKLFNFEFNSLLNKKIENAVSLTVENYSELSKKASFEIYKSSCTVRSSKLKVQEWKELRDYVLTCPTANYVPDRYAIFYFKFDLDQAGYSYRVNGKNFDIVEIKFNLNEDLLQVSQQDCDLSRMLEIPCVKEMFKNKHYAQYWTKNPYLMSPSLYNQIYKGALGEVVGKAILEEYTGNDVEDLEDYSLYEYFDFKIKNVYIDFKHWKEFSKSPRKQIEKIKWKLNRAKGEKAVIINIIKRGDHKSFTNVDEDVIEIPFLIDDNNDVSIEMIGVIENIIVG